MNRWKRMLKIGKHSRYECLQRPGQWCVGIGHANHPDLCSGCPVRKNPRLSV